MVSLPGSYPRDPVSSPNTREFLFESGHWHGPVTMLGWLNPAQPYGPGWAQQKIIIIIIN